MKCECADLRAKTGEWWDCDICYPTQAIGPPRETFALLPTAEVEELKSQLREARQHEQEMRETLDFIRPALPVLKNMCEGAGFKLGAAKAQEMIEAIAAIKEEPNDK